MPIQQPKKPALKLIHLQCGPLSGEIFWSGTDTAQCARSRKTIFQILWCALVRMVNISRSPIKINYRPFGDRARGRQNARRTHSAATAAVRAVIARVYLYFIHARIGRAETRCTRPSRPRRRCRRPAHGNPSVTLCRTPPPRSLLLMLHYYRTACRGGGACGRLVVLDHSSTAAACARTTHFAIQHIKTFCRHADTRDTRPRAALVRFTTHASSWCVCAPLPSCA